jgi:two-component system response regulator PilR (NtrC family)
VSERPLALIVDDEADLRTLMRLTLMRMGIDCELAASVHDAKRWLSQQRFDLCLTDMNLPDGSGLELVADIAERYPELPVAMITAYGSMDIAIDALKAGAFDFVSKPIEQARLRELVERALLVNQPATLATSSSQLSEQTLIGQSVVMQQLRTMLIKLSRSQAPVYISGESGTGKEVVARLIHQLGPRSSGPFVPVNCGAIPAELMESEFFGHKKGSFTGATEDKQGLFQSANGGTLFLDEVADLPLAMQVKLLRAIQEKKVRQIGTQTEISVDIRLLSATHKDLQRMVDAGHFRQDLFYRINVIEAALPALRERGHDVLLLADAFLGRLCTDWGIDRPTLSAAAQQMLRRYAFPGNVRELQNTLERALTLCEGPTIEPEHLLLDLRRGQLLPDEPTPAWSDDDEFPVLNTDPHPDPTAKISPSKASDPHPLQHICLTQLPEEGLEHYLQQIERSLILLALEKSLWNRTAAAKRLGMSFRSLRYRLKKLGLGEEDNDADEPVGAE